MTDYSAGHPILGNLFRQNRWANVTLIDVCAAVDAGVLDADAPGTFGTIRDTLWHTVNSENHFLAALQGHPDAGHLEPLAGPMDDFEVLRGHAMRIGDGLTAWAETIVGDPMVEGEWGDGPYHVPSSMFMAQALLHGREHRVQISEAMERAGVEAPDLDAWAWWESGGALIDGGQSQ